MNIRDGVHKNVRKPYHTGEEKEHCPVRSTIVTKLTMVRRRKREERSAW